MTGNMKALRKMKPGPGLEMQDRPHPGDQGQRGADQGPQAGHLRHRPAHLQVGRVVAEPAEAPGDHRPRVLRRDRRARRRSPPLSSRRAGDRRDARRLQPVLPVPHRQRPPLRERGHPRRRRRRLLRRLRRRPRVQPLARAQGRSTPSSPPSTTPSATPCTRSWPGATVGKTFLILGGGPIGIAAIPVCKAAGASLVLVSEVMPFRQELAEKMGADRVHRPRQGERGGGRPLA